MADKNEGFTGVQVEEQGGKQNTAVTSMGPTRYNAHLTSIPQAQQLDGGQTMLNAGITALAGSISKASEANQKGWREKTTTKLALKAKAMQGTDIAMNSIAETKKRNPFMKAVLGETVTTRVTEAQMVQNATTQLFNKTNEDMPKLAYMETGAAMEHMAQTGEDLIADIKDPELRELAKNTLLAQAPKLAATHYKERYALQRQKQVSNNAENIILGLTAYKTSLKGVLQPEEKEDILAGAVNGIFRPNDPLGLQQDPASIKEYRGQVFSQTMSDLKNGDKTAYDILMAIPEGHKDALTAQEKDGLQDAVGAFDTYRNGQGAGVIAQTRMMLQAATTPMEQEAAAQQARIRMGKWMEQGSQSPVDKKNQAVKIAQQEALIERNAGQWATNQVAVETAQAQRNVYGKGKIERADTEAGMSKSELKAESNRQVGDYLSELTGQPFAEAEIMGKNVLVDGAHWEDADGEEHHMEPVVVAQNINRWLSDGTRPMPDKFQRFIDLSLDGMTVGGAKGGIHTEEQLEEWHVTQALVEGTGANIDFSSEDWKKYHMMKRSVAAGETPEQFNSRWQRVQSNVGVVDPSSRKKKDRTAQVDSIIDRELGANTPDRVRARIHADYQVDLKSVDFGVKEAEAILTSQLRNSYTVVSGVRVDNGKELEKALGEGFTLNGVVQQLGANAKKLSLTDTLAQGSDYVRYGDYDEELSAISPVMMAMFGTQKDSDQKNLTDATRLQFSKIEYIPGDDSVEFGVIGGGVTRIPLDQIKRVKQLLAERAKRYEVGKGVQKTIEESNYKALNTKAPKGSLADQLSNPGDRKNLGYNRDKPVEEE